MSQTKRCQICKRELSLDKFNKRNASADGLQANCRICDSVRKEKELKTIYELRNKIIDESGGCQSKDCHSSPDQTRLLVTGFNYGLFDFDHIDESLKQHQKETTSTWIYFNMDEFLNRVKPNLQVLCVQCHRLKSNHSRRLGNKVHQKIHGRKLPSQFIGPGYDLFNQVEITNTSLYEDNWTFEDNWSVCRDSEGFLIKYIDIQEGSTQFQVFNKDGEQI